MEVSLVVTVPVTTLYLSSERAIIRINVQNHSVTRIGPSWIVLHFYTVNFIEKRMLSMRFEHPRHERFGLRTFFNAFLKIVSSCYEF